MTMKPPQEWINQQVIVRFPTQGSAQLLARLDGISDWGVTLTPIRFYGEGRVEASVVYRADSTHGIVLAGYGLLMRMNGCKHPIPSFREDPFSVIR